MKLEKNNFRAAFGAPKLILLIFLAIVQKGNAQDENTSYINPGLISTSLTFSPAKMLNRNEMNYYVSGYLIGRVHKNISIRSESHYLLPNVDTKFLHTNVRTMFGLEYGIPVNNFDFHVAFMPGVSFMTSNFSRSQKLEIIPTVSISGGMKFYVWKFFNLFVHVNYVSSQLNKLETVSGKADELVFTGGLGYNIQVLKKYR